MKINSLKKTSLLYLLLANVLFLNAVPNDMDAISPLSTTSHAETAENTINEYIPDLSKHFYSIQSKKSGYTLDVIGSGKDHGANICQYTNGNYDKQKFLFVKVPGEKNTYNIVVKSTGLILDVSGSGLDKGAKICQWTNTGDEDHKWILEPQGGGDFYRIKSKKSGYYLDVIGSGNDHGAGICQYTKVDSDKQIWKLIPSDPIIIPYIQAKTPLKSYTPKMMSPDMPSSFQEGVTGVEWVSFLNVKDPSKSLSWKVQNSPWYYLERKTTWVTSSNNYHYNTGAEGTGTDEKTWTVMKAWTKETQQSFSVTTGVEATLGGDAFGGSITASVSFTSSFSSSLSLTKQEEEEIKMPIPPGTAKALFSREETLTLYRMDGVKVPGAEWTTYGGTATAAYKREG
jgi:hypothetical protein